MKLLASAVLLAAMFVLAQTSGSSEENNSRDDVFYKCMDEVNGTQAELETLVRESITNKEVPTDRRGICYLTCLTVVTGLLAQGEPIRTDLLARYFKPSELDNKVANVKSCDTPEMQNMTDLCLRTFYTHQCDFSNDPHFLDNVQLFP